MDVHWGTSRGRKKRKKLKETRKEEEKTKEQKEEHNEDEVCLIARKNERALKGAYRNFVILELPEGGRHQRLCWSSQTTYQGINWGWPRRNAVYESNHVTKGKMEEASEISY